MNNLLKQCLPASLILGCLSSAGWAISPIQGWYGGLIIGGNFTPSLNYTTALPVTPRTPDGTTRKAQLTYSNLIDVGGQIGYRIDNLRLEGEFLYNNSPYNGLTVGNLFFNNPSYTTSGLQFEGSTNTYALMFNGYIDFYSLIEADNIVPYAGLGIGAAQIQNVFQFNYNGSPIQRTESTINNIVMEGQIMGGISYFLDDFTAFSIDFRYLTGTNATVAGYLTTATFRPQIYTINLLFNGSFNL